MGEAAFAGGTAIEGGPATNGEIWPDSKLLAALGARVGDQLAIGSSQFRVSRVLIARPDQGGGFADLAPGALLNAGDLAATQLLLPGSRAGFALLIAGAREPVLAFKEWLKANKKPRERLLDVSEASPQVRNAVDRGRPSSCRSPVLFTVLLCAIARGHVGAPLRCSAISTPWRC